MTLTATDLAALRVTYRAVSYSCVSLDRYPYPYGQVATDSPDTTPWRTHDYTTDRKARRLARLRAARLLRV